MTNPEDDLQGRLSIVTGREADLLQQAVALDQEDARAAGAVGYSARLWAQVSLPYRNPGDLPYWERRNGTVSLILRPGLVKEKRHGPVVAKYPFGVTPRLLMTWMATEAVLTQDPVLDLGTSLRQFLRVLGMSTGGADNRRFRDQVQRLTTASLVVMDSRPNSLSGATFTFADKWELFWTPREPQEEALFPSTITLSDRFYRSIIEAPVPIDLRALTYLRRNGGGGLPIDIYVWLAHRMYVLNASGAPGSRPIPWEYLANQFGSQYKLVRQFKAKFLPALREALTAYPQARVIVTDIGLVLRPSPTPIPPKSLPR